MTPEPDTPPAEVSPEPGAPPAETGFDYVVVGAGAGGGPLAANLAAAGMRVLLLDAGGAEENDNYLVPAFHADASEDPVQRWDYFVRHYADEQQHQRDSKLVPDKGILYPRAGAIGGCTAHHALITVYPYNRDWDEIARETGDASWHSSVMRRYFERLERCTYRPRPKEPPRHPLLAALLKRLPFISARYRNDSRHGFDGWLPTDLADPGLVIQDKQLLKVIRSAAEDTLADFLGRPLSPLEGLGSFVDPNDWRVQTHALQGLWQIPLSTADGRRSAARERVEAVQRSHPDNLVVRSNALVTQVVLDESGAATGVDYLDQAHAYRADPGSHEGLPAPPLRRVLAFREVILSAGAFNTPQLLMLSGIGPREELERHGIRVRVDLKGVGANLQDRYEVGVVSQMDREFPVIKDCDFHAPEPGGGPDRCYRAWQRGEGLYTTNGAVVGITRKSRPELDAPDLFIFGGPFDFRGYRPGYSRDLTRHRDRFTWAILKSRTHNTGGTVRLRSADPRDTPLVNFHYFTEGTDTDGLDLEAMADAVEFVRGMNRRADSVILKELWPGKEVAGRESLRRFVRDEAWGHHASCSCRMGRADDPSAVVDGSFRVRGVDRLRIVDASVFPRIPGFFIATSIYMISEKASDAILGDAARTGNVRGLVATHEMTRTNARSTAMNARRRAPWRSRPGYRTSLPWRIITGIAEYVDRHNGWDKLAVIPGLLTLLGLRVRLRQKNLHDTTGLPSVHPPEPAPPSESHKVNRTADGSHNDLDEPRMGMTGTRFGRNIPLDRIAPATPESVLSRPNPREVSRALLTRHELVPAESVNSLVGAWLQFMIRDWFSHGTSPTERPWEVPLMDDDPWPEKPMRIMRTPDDPTRDPQAPAGTPDTRVNVSSHWWDASQVYGSTEEEQRRMRTGKLGKVHIWNNNQQNAFSQDPANDPSLVPGFWLGLAMMHKLFALEHNAICDHLHAAYPSWGDEELFQRARLVNAALLAKIHTVEWTPAVISHPTTVKALRANWWGIAGERVHNLFGRLGESEVISGIPGGKTDHYGVPYALTEEFVAVYRMHPLIRDEWHLRSVTDNATLSECTLRDIAGPEAVKVMQTTPMADLFYSFGTLHPGLVTLHNFPKFLQEYERPDGHLQDLAATDILRSRELGVPRYNEFRRLLRLRPAESFEDLTGNPAWAKEIRRLYGDDIEKVDLMVGMYAEKLPVGFAFSDTAFRIFILMASRRLNSDRFFTEYYTPEVYSKAGMAWIDDNSMVTVLLRHYPELRTALAGLNNAFVPWHTPQGSGS